MSFRERYGKVFRHLIVHDIHPLQTVPVYCYHEVFGLAALAPVGTLCIPVRNNPPHSQVLRNSRCFLDCPNSSKQNLVSPHDSPDVTNFHCPLDYTIESPPMLNRV